MPDFSEATGVLTDSSTYVKDVGAGAAGYMGSIVANNIMDRFVPRDVPDEAGGLAVIALAQMFAPASYRKPLQVGAGTNTGVELADRVGVDDMIEGMGA